MKKRLREYEDLCALGLPTRELVPMALRLLEGMLGGAQLAFMWANERLEAVEVYSHVSAGLASSRLYAEQSRLYAEEFYNRREGEVGPTFTELLKRKIPVLNFSETLHYYHRSALHAECFRPLGLRHAIRAPVIDGEHRHGMFAFLRARDEPAYSERDEQIMVHAARHLAYAFELEKAGRLVQGEEGEDLETGVLLLDAAGKVLHGCDRGLSLFYDATRADGLAQQPSSLVEALPAALAQGAARKGPSDEIPVTNRRGTFVFRPFPMRSFAADSSGVVAVTVRRRGSLAASLWQASANFRLSGRERQAAVLLGMGWGYDDIARHLELSRNTTVSYVRRAYEKLGVSQREQLVRALLTAPA